MSIPTYWHWFLRGSGGNPGFRRLVNKWLIGHFIVAIAVAFIVPVSIREGANSVLLPLAGILIGLSFAWAGNAQALMQTEEFERLASRHKGGFVEYVYTFQTAILAILATLVIWGLAGLDVFDSRWPTPANAIAYFGVKTVLFAAFSMTLRECWHAVVGAGLMLIVRREVKRLE